MNKRGLLWLSQHAALAPCSIETRASRTPRSTNAGYLVRCVARSQGGHMVTTSVISLVKWRSKVRSDNWSNAEKIMPSLQG